MKALILFSIAISVLLFSCKENEKQTSNSILNYDNLKTQSFYINVKEDTTLVTKSGCIIKIKENTFSSDSTNIKLEIKEAISNTDIVLGGLTTMSGKNSLASGGMIYFKTAKGYTATINKNVEVLIPTQIYNPNMDVFKGVEANGKIDWQEPEPLPKDSTLLSIENGKALFKANCANCHYPHKDFTGPALAGVTKRASRKTIYNFIHNPAGSNDPYSIELKKKWKSSGIMTAFPQLQNDELDNILAYIETFKSNEKRVYTYVSDSSKNSSSVNLLCEDSCASYLTEVEKLLEEQSIIKNNEKNEFFNLNRTIAIPTPLSIDNVDIKEEEIATLQNNLAISKITPTTITATFYTININAFGWYNIDILQKEENDCIESELMVNIATTLNADCKVMLILPSVKAFVEGGKLKDSKQYGFDEANGKIYLPQNNKGYIIAFTEINNQLFFGQTSFVTKEKQEVNVTVAKTTKEEMEVAIRNLKLDGITANINRNETQKKLEVISSEIESNEKLKPKNCDCDMQYSMLSQIMDSPSKK